MARSGRRQYAKGRHALAECQRSGQKMRYRDLVEDGHVPGLLVHPDWWEPKHPQEIPVSVDDPIALWRPAPEISKPPGEGDDPRTGCCNLDPSTPANTTTSGSLSGGETIVGINDALRFDEAQGRETFAYIQMDNGDWYCSPIVVPIRCTPTYVINLSYPFDGPSPVSPGNKVIAGNDTNFVLAAAAVPSSLSESGSASSETSAIQINAVGGCPPYLYQWEWVTQPDPLITITSPTSSSSTLTIGALADGNYSGEILVTITDTGSTPQETTVNIPVTITLASILGLIFGADYNTGTGDQSVLTSEDNLTTLTNFNLDEGADNWQNQQAMGYGNYVVTQSDETEGWFSRDNGATYHRINTYADTVTGLGNGGGNSMIPYTVTYGTEFDINALIRADGVEIISDKMGNKTISSSGIAPIYSDETGVIDFGDASIQLNGNGTGYLRAYNAADSDFTADEYTIEFTYKPGTGDLTVDATTEKIILHSDKTWGTAGSWYISFIESAASTGGIRFVSHNGATVEAEVALAVSTANELASPNGYRHFMVSRWVDHAGDARFAVRVGATGNVAQTLTGATHQIDKNFRIGSDGSGSSTGRSTIANLGWADGKIQDIRVTDGFARGAYFGSAMGTGDNRMYQQEFWPTGTTEDMLVFNRTDSNNAGTVIQAVNDFDVHIQGSWFYRSTNNIEGAKALYGMTLHNGEFYAWEGTAYFGTSSTNRPMRITKWNPATKLTPWRTADITEVVDLTTLVPVGWTSYWYTQLSGYPTGDGANIWIGSDGTNLIASILSIQDTQRAIAWSANNGSTWNVNSNEISWASTLDYPMQMVVAPDGYVYFVSFGGVWYPSGPVSSNPTYTYTNIRSLYTSNRGNCNQGIWANNRLYIVGQSNFSPATAALWYSDDQGASFTQITPIEQSALTGEIKLNTVGTYNIGTP